MIYKIYEGYLENVEKKLKRIAKKCDKYGNNFVYKKIGESVEEIKDSLCMDVAIFAKLFLQIIGFFIGRVQELNMKCLMAINMFLVFPKAYLLLLKSMENIIIFYRLKLLDVTLNIKFCKKTLDK